MAEPSDYTRSRNPTLQPLLDAALEHYRLDWHGYHGPHHWHRVQENATLICRAEGITSLVPETFAFLHDACRRDEGRDSGHGARAAEWAQELRARGVFEHLDEASFELLLEACRYHSGGLIPKSIIVGTCWDADRLDLLRVGTTPDARFMTTEYAKRDETISQACGRALLWLRG